MPHLTSADKHSFKENGCLIVRGALTSAQIQAAQDALWTGIEADRDDHATWVEAGPRTPVPAHHPAIRAAVHESPLFAMMEEMVGEGQLNSGSAGPAPGVTQPKTRLGPCPSAAISTATTPLPTACPKARSAT